MSQQSISSLSHEKRKFPPSDEIKQRSYLDNPESYQEMYQRSLDDPDSFWSEIAEDFFWFRKWDKIHSYDWTDKIEVKWFEGAQTNICYNALDRHLPEAKDRLAFLWVGNEANEEKRITYGELHKQVCQCANTLKQLGVTKGDRVAIYLPMIPELAVSLLACARIGAIHSVVFGGFSAESLKDRILDAGCSYLITSDGAYRGAKQIPMKATVDRAIQLCANEGHKIRHCLVVKRSGVEIDMQDNRDVWWHECIPNADTECTPEAMDAEDPLFILYTSGSTGKPKGVLHTTAGYMVYAATTFKYVFDYHPEDLFWCTADIGWVTGHSYIVYGPLCNQASSVMFEGIPTYPAVDRFWEIIERYKINIFYTAPTAIRALMRESDDHVTRHDLSSLRILGTVGEPINPEAWIWYYDVVGQKRCPVVDTWWQTETGGILITPLPGAMTLKPGSASKPFFGVEAAVLRDDGTECKANEGGYLVIKRPWPGIMRTVFGQHERFKETYFSRFQGMYLTGDSARRDEDGDFWLMGRIDDVLNVSGHRIGTAEVESALVSHSAVAETAVVGFPHEIKGQGIYAFVTLKSDVLGPPEKWAQHPSSAVASAAEGEAAPLRKELIQHVRNEIGPTATPDHIQFAPALPKTRSGKIMRRILRKVAEGQSEQIGDTTTLADPSVVESLIKGMEES